MPPEGEGQPFTAEQVGLVRAWIDQGAKWPDAASVKGGEHWAYKKPVRHDPPPVNTTTWPKNPIDSFILLRLDKEGLQPSPELDRRDSFGGCLWI